MGLLPVLGEVAPFLVVAICTLVLFRDDLFLGSIFYERDTELFYLPLLRWYLGQLHAGQLPLWMPLIFGGYPLFADGELGMLYPPNVLLGFFLGAETFLQVSRALHVFLAGAFMIVFLRVLGVGRVGALVGGIAFAFGSFFVTQIQHENVVRSAVWLPLILAFVELALRSTGWRRQQWLIAAGLAMAMSALGVHIQPVFMTLVCLGLFVLYRVVVGPVAGRWWERVVLLVWAPLLVTGHRAGRGGGPVAAPLRARADVVPGTGPGVRPGDHLAAPLAEPANRRPAVPVPPAGRPLGHPLAAVGVVPLPRDRAARPRARWRAAAPATDRLVLRAAGPLRPARRARRAEPDQHSSPALDAARASPRCGPPAATPT